MADNLPDLLLTRGLWRAVLAVLPLVAGRVVGALGIGDRVGRSFGGGIPEVMGLTAALHEVLVALTRHEGAPTPGARPALRRPRRARSTGGGPGRTPTRGAATRGR
jgi:hypothetical protein